MFVDRDEVVGCPGVVIDHAISVDDGVAELVAFLPFGAGTVGADGNDDRDLLRSESSSVELPEHRWQEQ